MTEPIEYCRNCVYTFHDFKEVLVKPDWTPPESEWRITDHYELDGYKAIRLYDGRYPRHNCADCGNELGEYFIQTDKRV